MLYRVTVLTQVFFVCQFFIFYNLKKTLLVVFFVFRYHKSMKETSEVKALYDAFALLENSEEIKRFMIDLCTPGEINAFSERWAIARLLEEGQLSYRDISAKTGASTTTVARVARFLRQEPYQGYKVVLDRLK